MAKLGPGSAESAPDNHNTTSALTARRDSSLSRLMMSRRTLALRRSKATRSRPRMSCRIDSATARRTRGCSITGKSRSWASAINCECSCSPSRLRATPLSEGLNNEHCSCVSSSANCLRNRVALILRLRAACMKQPERAVTLKHWASTGSTSAASVRQETLLSRGAPYSAMRRRLPVPMIGIDDSLSFYPCDPSCAPFMNAV